MSDSAHSGNHRGPARSLFACLVAVAVASCAAKPEKIRPIPSDRDLSSATCESLGADKARIEQDLQALYAVQREIRADDTVAVLLAGFPTRSFVTKNEVPKQIGALKGEALVVSDALVIHDCNIPAVKLPPRWKPKKPVRYTGGAPYE